MSEQLARPANVLLVRKAGVVLHDPAEPAECRVIRQEIELHVPVVRPERTQTHGHGQEAVRDLRDRAHDEALEHGLASRAANDAMCAGAKEAHVHRHT